MKGLKGVFLTLIGLLFFAGCGSRDPQPIQFGTDQCSYCRMTISNPKFGAELITEKGRIHKFDALECMVHYLDDQGNEKPTLYCVPFDKPGTLGELNKMVFVISPKIKSPMGANLASFSSAKYIPEEFAELQLSWMEVQSQLKK